MSNSVTQQAFVTSLYVENNISIDQLCNAMPNAVSAYFTSEQILPFGFAEQSSVMQWRTAVTAYLKSEQILLFIADLIVLSIMTITATPSPSIIYH